MDAGQVDIVEQGPRGPRRMGLLTILVALVAVPLVASLADRETNPPDPVVTAAPVIREAINVKANAVYPRESGAGGTRTLWVTFPDGSRAQIDYPTDLSLAALGTRPYTSGTVTVSGEAEEFRSLTAPLYGEAETAAGRPMIRRLVDDVTLWPGPLGLDGAGSVLLFAFGDWRLALQDEHTGMTFEQRLAWAKHLRGRPTPDGFLTLSADGPVRLSRPGELRDGVLVGPQLWFGGLSRRMLVLAPVPDCARLGRASVVLDPRHTIAGSTCRDGFYLAASGDPGFVRGALSQVRVRTCETTGPICTSRP